MGPTGEFYQKLEEEITLILYNLIEDRNRRCCYLVTKSCLILCHPMDRSLPGSSVHGISQARILEWAVVPFSRASYEARD